MRENETNYNKILE